MATKVKDEAETTDREALSRLAAVEAPNVDAFGAEEEDEEDPEQIDAGLDLGEPSNPEEGIYVIPATLKKATNSAASNGNNITLDFECGVSYGMLLMGHTGTEAFAVDFDKLMLGEGATIKSVSTRGGADGVVRTSFGLQFPGSASHVVRSAWDMVNRYAVLRLEAQQGRLGLADGSSVDLTHRAE
jgi:hypothetical protein